MYKVKLYASIAVMDLDLNQMYDNGYLVHTVLLVPTGLVVLFESKKARA